MEVTKTNLATYIASLTASATPYPIEITETEASDWEGGFLNASSIIQLVKDNVISGVYIDLAGTVIPSSVNSLYFTFSDCTALTTAPAIPSGVTNLEYAFYGCASLTTAPTIPSGVTMLYHTFNGCASLTTAPVIPSSVTIVYYTFAGCSTLTTAPTIPSSVTNLLGAFYGCTSLTTAPLVPISVTNLTATFSGCTALTTISVFEVDVTTCTMTDAFKNCTSLTAIYVAEATEADWHLLYTDTDATGTDYEIYDTDGTLLSSGTVTGTSQVLELSGKSDELVISDNLTSALAIESATTQLQWHHTGLPYDDELFIFNAKNPTTVISNVLTTTLRRNASFTLGTYPDGKKIRIANTHATNTITVTMPSGITYAGAITSFTLKPYEKIEIELFGTTWDEVGNEGIGTIKATGSTTADFGRLLCQGQALSRTTYARLFNRIGTAFGAGNGSTTFNLPDFREVALVGAGTNELNASAIRAHDTYTVGQFKDDAFENHTHYVQRDTGGSYAECKSVPAGRTDSWYTGTGFGTSESGRGAVTRGKRMGVNYQIKY